MWLNVGSGTHNAAKPWHNVDSMRNDWTQPDEVVDPDKPLPYEDKSCERILLSHVLEHVPWEHVPEFLADMHRLCSGEMLVVGPDVYRTIKAFKAGKEAFDLVASVLEHKNWPPDMAGWPGAPHHWNCHEERVREALKRTGWEVSDPSPETLSDWPLVGWSPVWQFVLMARPSTA